MNANLPLDSLAIVIDVGIGIVFLISFIKGCKRGIIEMIFRLLGLAVGALLAFYCSAYLVKWLSSFEFIGGLKTFMHQNFFAGAEYDVPVSSLTEGDLLSNLSIPNILVSILIQNVDVVGDMTAGDYLSYAITMELLQTIVFSLLFFIGSALIRALGKKIVESIDSSSGKAFNRILGGLVNVVITSFYLLVLCLFLTFFGEEVHKVIDMTVILKFFYQNNILSYFFLSYLQGYLDNIKAALDTLPTMPPIENIPDFTGIPSIPDFTGFPPIFG